MALMYFRDADKRGDGPKQWMGKTAVRKIVERKDEKYKDLEIKAIGLEAQVIMGEACIKANEDYIKDLEKTRKKLKIGMGVLGGYSILSTIIWGCCYFS